MKKHLTALLLLVSTLTVFAQTVVPSGSPNQVTDFKGGVKVEKTLNLPVTDTDAFPAQDKLGQVRVSPTDSIVRYFNGINWVPLLTAGDVEAQGLSQTLAQGNMANNDIILDDETDQMDYTPSVIIHKKYGKATTLKFADQTTSVDYTIPAKDADDTFAMLSDVTAAVSDRVPYAGATSDVNIGTYNLRANAIGAGYGDGTSIPAKLSVKNTAIPTTGLSSVLFQASNSANVYGFRIYVDDQNRQFVTNQGSGNVSTNTAFGIQSLRANSTGSDNTAYGIWTLTNNTTGLRNSAFGTGALYFNTIGEGNSAFGQYALYKNTEGTRNVAIGNSALYNSTTASRSVAIGALALNSNVTGENNTATGYQALTRSTAGENTAYGWNSGAWVSTGIKNVLYGQGTVNDAGGSPTTGSYNSIFGNIILTDEEKAANNLVIIGDGAGNRMIEKSATGAVDIKGNSLSFNGSSIALNNNTVHLTGSETITGTKTFAAPQIFTGGGTDVSAVAISNASLDNAGLMALTVPATGGQKVMVGTVSGQATGFFEFGNNVGGTAKPGIALGNGTASRDTFLYRDGANVLKTNGNLTVGGGITTGTTITAGGTITAPAYSNFKATTFTTSTKFTPDPQNISDSPVSGEIYHDLLAFNTMWGAPAFQTSVDGTAWTTEAVNNNLFAQKEDQNVTYSATTQKYLRWTWNSAGLSYCNAKFLKINWAYVAGTYNRNITVETSADGTTWTTRHSSTSTAIQVPEFYNLQDHNADTYFRLTIVNNGTADTPLAGIKVLTARAGNQGRGKEYQYPYSWDAARNIILPAAIRSNTYRSNGSGTTFTNASNVVWATVDETAGKLTLNNAPTAGSNEAVRAVDVQFAVPSYIAVTSAYTTGTARTITANGTFTITLATTGIPDGMEYCIKNIGSGTITLSGIIDGVSGATLTAGQVSILRKTGSTFIKIN